MDKVAGDDDLQPLDGFDLPGDELDTELAAASNGSSDPLADAVEASDSES